jgi:hypothetical protein
MKLLTTLTMTLMMVWAVNAQRVEVLRWPSQATAPAIKLGAEFTAGLPLFRAGLARLPESAVVALCLSQPSLLGLTPAEAVQLQKLTTDYYTRIQADAWCRGAPSALPYCSPNFESTPQYGLSRLLFPPH